MKIPFNTIWGRKNNVYQNNVDIRISGVIARKGSIKINKGVSFMGIDWSLFEGRDIDVETEGEFMVIKGIY